MLSSKSEQLGFQLKTEHSRGGKVISLQIPEHCSANLAMIALENVHQLARTGLSKHQDAKVSSGVTETL